MSNSQIAAAAQQAPTLHVPPPEGIPLEITSAHSPNRILDIGITRVTECDCKICELNDTFYNGKTILFRMTPNDRIKLVICPKGSTFALSQNVYKCDFLKPELGATVELNNYVAEKRRVFKPHKLISPFKADRKQNKSVRVINVNSGGSKRWTQLLYNGQMVGADGTLVAAVVTAKVVLGTIAALALGGVI